MNLTPEEQLDVMTIATLENDAQSRLTLYAVVCTEHGGLVAETAPQAIDAALNANRIAELQGVSCEYAAVAIGLDAELVARLFAAPPEGS